jgi:hypothetical protein
MMLSNSRSARFVRFLRRYELSLPTITLWVLLFSASESRMRSMFGHSEMISPSLARRLGLIGQSLRFVSERRVREGVSAGSGLPSHVV